jgi:hypothetical protein
MVATGTPTALTETAILPRTGSGMLPKFSKEPPV